MHFDPALPINARRDEIRAAVEAHPVVIVCGETGSGKTTQLPKILLEMDPRHRIGHTQPRRIAARSVAARIAEELGTELGDRVGYKVRFHDQVGKRTAIKLMTDGILLAETQSDRELRQYDRLIIDEAHERSLNIDFLLGYLRNLVERRSDLKVVITSATIDAERFSRHFNDAPVIEVSGRLYPVDVRYRPVAGDAEDTTREEEEQALADAVDELCREGPGDVLVFLPGEREIREASQVLRKANFKGEILPLYSRLSTAEQDRVFKPGKERRVVLATNVAETSLTVPRIRYVVDTGDARVKRYSYRNKVEMLRVEPISQAAAQQRAGRCGRVAEGVCIRLYSEEDFAKRPAFTDPELLRSSLASVILRAKSLGLGEVEAFPFVDPPNPRAIADGYDLLTELGAVDDEKKLTPTGEELARLPLDPRVGRMLVAAREEGCLAQVRIIAAALSVQDPRQRPLERAAAADERHARFADQQSDFLSFLKLWKLQDESGLRRLCRDNFLSYPRMREWRDVHEQLKQALDWPESSVKPKREGELQAEGYRAIHRALLAGLLGNVGMRDEEGAGASAYVGARGIKFWVHPGSWTKKPGKWIVAAELVETTRLFARTVASIEPRWLEEIGLHLLKRSRSDPHWEKDRGEVVALERGTLYGLPVYANRRVPFAPYDPDLARDIFIRSALVEGDFDTRAPFFAHNRRLVADIQRLEHKSRRPDILVDDELIHAFYDERIPREIHGAADFERWRRQAEAARPRLLHLAREDLMRHEAAGITTQNFPPSLDLGPNRYALEYHFEPGSPRDGVTMTVPLALLNQVPAARTEWLVPGLLKEKVKALAKSIPQRLRHKLGALDDFAARFSASVPPSDLPLTEALRRYVRDELNLDVPVDAFRPDSAPPHLHMNFRVLDEDGRQLDTGRNLPELKRGLGKRTEAILQQEAPIDEGERYTGWTMGDLPELMEISRGGHTLVGYPALVDAGEEGPDAGVTLQVFDSPEKAGELHRAGVLRLLAIAFRDRIRDIERSLAKDVVLGSLKADILAAALGRTFLQESVPATQAEFGKRLDEGRSRFTLIAQEIARTAGGILAERAALEKKLNAAEKAHPQTAQDIRQQLARLLAPGWLGRTPWERLQHLPRYLKAASMRLDKLRADPARDARLAAELVSLEQPYRREAAARARHGAPSTEFEQFGWLLEELRVSLFAQELKTPVPVSAKRLAKLWQSLRK